MHYLSWKNSVWYLPFTTFYRTHEKWKDSLETRTEQANLRAYVENQAIPKSIFLYRTSKYKQTKRPVY